ncbi:MAG: hypothetical protein U1E50_15815 [Caulobacteraceae bacterium]
MSPAEALAHLLEPRPAPPNGPARLDILTAPLEDQLHLWIAVNPRTREIAAASIDRRDDIAANSFIGGIYVSGRLYLDGFKPYHAAGREILGVDVDVDFAQLTQVYGDRDYKAPAPDPARLLALRAELEACLAR